MKVWRIGIIGSENSHAKAFASIFSQNEAFKDMQITAVHGDEGRESSEAVQAFFPEAVIVEKPEDMLGNVDAVMITSRDGKLHYPYAKPFLEAKIPLFVDKPFTVDPLDALALISLAKENKVPLCGGSTLKCCPDVAEMGKIRQALGKKLISGFVSAPLDFYSPYSGFFFYASHLVEMCLETFGWEPEAVTAHQKDDQVTALLHYPDFDVACAYTPFCDRYFLQLAGRDDVLEAKEVDLTMAFELEAEEFAQMLRTGQMLYSYTQLITPVFCMNAIKESYETKKTVTIAKE